MHRVPARSSAPCRQPKRPGARSDRTRSSIPIGRRGANASAATNRGAAHVTKIDMPAIRALGISAAGEGGHGPSSRQRTIRLISDLATDKTKREMFAKLADHLNTLADEVERAMAAKQIEEDR